jgi:hypothetical protein
MFPDIKETFLISGLRLIFEKMVNCKCQMSGKDKTTKGDRNSQWNPSRKALQRFS